MVTNLKKKLDALPQARCEQILAEADRLHAEYLTLQELRKAKKEQLAKTLRRQRRCSPG